MFFNVIFNLARICTEIIHIIIIMELCVISACQMHHVDLFYSVPEYVVTYMTPMRCDGFSGFDNEMCIWYCL